MKTALYDNTKVVAYFLWEYTKHENALSLWYCAEDIALYLETKEIMADPKLDMYVKRSKYDNVYINFVRNLAYRIYIFTNNDDHLNNWFITEKLLANKEWCESVIRMAELYRVLRNGESAEMGDIIKTEKIRNLFNI